MATRTAPTRRSDPHPFRNGCCEPDIDCTPEEDALMYRQWPYVNVWKNGQPPFGHPDHPLHRTPRPGATPTRTEGTRRMSFTPKDIEISDDNPTEDFKQLCRLLQDIGIGTSDYTANHAVAIHPRIVDTLRANGVDGQAGLFGRGSIAENHAKAVYAIMRKLAEAQMTSANLAQALERAWQAHVVVPVKEAQNAKHKKTMKV